MLRYIFALVLKKYCFVLENIHYSSQESFWVWNPLEIVSCRVVLCHVVLGHVVSCYVVLYPIELYPIILSVIKRYFFPSVLG